MFVNMTPYDVIAFEAAYFFTAPATAVKKGKLLPAINEEPKQN